MHPLIRMVFALGAKESNVEVCQLQGSRGEKQAAESKTRGFSNFTSYDTWCAKASTETFAVIDSDLTFSELLKIQKAFPGLYDNGEGEEFARRQMHSMAHSNEAHWLFGQASC